HGQRTQGNERPQSDQPPPLPARYSTMPDFGLFRRVTLSLLHCARCHIHFAATLVSACGLPPKPLPFQKPGTRRPVMFTAPFARLALALLLLLSATVAPLHAQNKNHDVQALLANDDALAALKQQLASKQINNIEYTRQTQQLAKTRNEIVARYDRAGQRELVALYRAAAADKRTAAAEAARKAAADARAQAIADAQAKQAAEHA